MVPVTFLAGAAVGAVAAYVYKDEEAKQWLSETGEKLKEGTASFMASFKKKPAEETEAPKTGEVVEGTVEEAVTQDDAAAAAKA